MVVLDTLERACSGLLPSFDVTGGKTNIFSNLEEVFMRTSFSRCLLMSLVFLIRCWSAAAQIPGEPTPTISSQLGAPEIPQAGLVPVARLEGLEFVNGSGSQIVLERDGKRYLIDTKSQTIREFVPTTVASAQAPVPPGQTTTAPPAAPVAKPEEKKEPETYYTEDIVLFSLPTAHHLPKKALMIDFTHRFSFSEAFAPGAISNFLGTDGFSLSALGFTYGITDRWFAGIYRTPTNIGRIIQLSTGLQLSREDLGHPFSSTIRVGVEGTDHFRNKYIPSLELAFARSIKNRAQVYFSPTVSFNNRPLRIVANEVFQPGPISGKNDNSSWRRTFGRYSPDSGDHRRSYLSRRWAPRRDSAFVHARHPKEDLSTLFHSGSDKLSGHNPLHALGHSPRLWL